MGQGKRAAGVCVRRYNSYPSSVCRELGIKYANVYGAPLFFCRAPTDERDEANNQCENRVRRGDDLSIC